MGKQILLKKVLAIIPARYASTRLPGKPLLDLGGKSMIQRVYEQVLKCSSIDDIIIATDDERISNEALNFGGKALMTAPHHQSGTERCGEILQLMANKFDIVVNIQGDEPFIQPEQIAEVLMPFENDETQIATLIRSIRDSESISNPNVVKVTASKSGKALYFSRSPIPFIRDYSAENWLNEGRFYQHVGMYAYKASTLLEINQLPMSTLEKMEKLEQLRWLENDYSITVKETSHHNFGIDTPEDLEKAKQLIENN